MEKIITWAKANPTKILSISIASLGVLSQSALEYLLSPDKHFIIFSAILVAGAGRLYLFYEGSSLSSYSEKHARTAFVLSILISIVFLGYILAIWIVKQFDAYLLLLFFMVTLTVIFVEWVFSKRISFGVRPEVLEAETRLAEVSKNLADTETRLTAVSSELETAKRRLSELTEIVADHEAEIQKTETRLTELLPAAEYGQLFAGQLLIADSVKYSYCPKCHNRNDLPGQKSTELRCTHRLSDNSICDTLIWKKP